jgi:hypothetical protein
LKYESKHWQLAVWFVKPFLNSWKHIPGIEIEQYCYFLCQHYGFGGYKMERRRGNIYRDGIKFEGKKRVDENKNYVCLKNKKLEI